MMLFLVFLIYVPFMAFSEKEIDVYKIGNKKIQCHKYYNISESIHILPYSNLFYLILNKAEGGLKNTIDEVSLFNNNLKTIDCNTSCGYLRESNYYEKIIKADCIDLAPSGSVDDLVAANNYPAVGNSFFVKGTYLCNTTLCNNVPLIELEIIYSRKRNDRWLHRFTVDKARVERFKSVLYAPNTPMTRRLPGSSIKCVKYINYLPSYYTYDMIQENSTEIVCEYNCFNKIIPHYVDGRAGGVTYEGGCKDIGISNSARLLGNSSCDKSLCNSIEELTIKAIREMLKKNSSFVEILNTLFLEMEKQLDMMEQVYYNHNPRPVPHPFNDVLKFEESTEKNDKIKGDGRSENENNSLGVFAKITPTLLIIIISLMTIS